MNLNAATDAIRRQAASLLLLAFAFAQLVEITHQGEHSELDPGERCATCVQLDKPGSAAAPPAAVVSVEFSAQALPAPRRQVIARALLSRPSARAPPFA